MKTIDNGALVTVKVDRDEVFAFKRTWPTSKLPNRSVLFQFDKRNGDLVDMEPNDIDGDDVVALSHDAQRFAGL